MLTTTREIAPTGLGAKASIELSDADRFKRGLGPAKKEVTAIRERWAALTNEHLREHGIEARIDHRTLEAQGIAREPTVHLGPAVSELERRGIRTQVGRRLEQEAREAGQRRLELAAERGRLEREERELTKSILDLSGDLEAAKRERDRQTTPAKNSQELQREGREAWRKLQAEREAKGPQQEAKDAQQEQEPKPKPKTLAPSLEQQRAQAIEAWRRMRERPAPDPRREKDRELDRGPEDDFEP